MHGGKDKTEVQSNIGIVRFLTEDFLALVGLHMPIKCAQLTVSKLLCGVQWKLEVMRAVEEYVGAGKVARATTAPERSHSELIGLLVNVKERKNRV